jgi:hypothetical protein
VNRRDLNRICKKGENVEMIDFAYIESSLDSLSEEQSRRIQSALVRLRNTEPTSEGREAWNAFASAVDARLLAKRRRAHAEILARTNRVPASV